MNPISKLNKAIHTCSMLLALSGCIRFTDQNGNLFENASTQPPPPVKISAEVGEWVSVKTGLKNTSSEKVTELNVTLKSQIPFCPEGMVCPLSAKPYALELQGDCLEKTELASNEVCQLSVHFQSGAPVDAQDFIEVHYKSGGLALSSEREISASAFLLPTPSPFPQLPFPTPTAFPSPSPWPSPVPSMSPTPYPIPSPLPAAPRCSLSVSKSIARGGETISATMQTFGVVSSATINGIPVSSSGGTTPLQSTINGKQIVRGDVQGPGGIGSCQTSYQVSWCQNLVQNRPINCCSVTEPWNCAQHLLSIFEQSPGVCVFQATLFSPQAVSVTGPSGGFVAFYPTFGNANVTLRYTSGSAIQIDYFNYAGNDYGRCNAQ